MRELQLRGFFYYIFLTYQEEIAKLSACFDIYQLLLHYNYILFYFVSFSSKKRVLSFISINYFSNCYFRLLKSFICFFIILLSSFLNISIILSRSLTLSFQLPSQIFYPDRFKEISMDALYQLQTYLSDYANVLLFKRAGNIDWQAIIIIKNIMLGVIIQMNKIIKEVKEEIQKEGKDIGEKHRNIENELRQIMMNLQMYEQKIKGVNIPCTEDGEETQKIKQIQSEIDKSQQILNGVQTWLRKTKELVVEIKKKATVVPGQVVDLMDNVMQKLSAQGNQKLRKQQQKIEELNQKCLETEKMEKQFNCLQLFMLLLIIVFMLVIMFYKSYQKLGYRLQLQCPSRFPDNRFGQDNEIQIQKQLALNYKQMRKTWPFKKKYWPLENYPVKKISITDYHLFYPYNSSPIFQFDYPFKFQTSTHN